MESVLRLVLRENMISPLEQTTVVKVASGYDISFRWFLNRVLDVIPDVDEFDLAAKGAAGFNISISEMTLFFLLLLAYLIPLSILAYHLMRSREIAGNT
jgi:hypothetical protein